MNFFSTQPIYFLDETRTHDGITILSLDELLKQSKATPAFKEDVLKFRNSKKSPRISYNYGAPRIKVLRVIMKLLEVLPDEPIEAVKIQGRSSCSKFKGVVEISPSGKKYEFLWDCAWRAHKHHVTNQWGMIDQAAAAHMFGYQCFSVFQEVP